MKKIIFSSMLLIMSVTSFSQQSVEPDYMQTSKNHKITATVFVVSGGLLTSIGILEWSSGFSQGFDLSNPNAGDSKMKTGNVLVITGGVLMLGSIPLFISSAKNKKIAMALTADIKMEKVQVIQQRSFVQNSYPTLSVKINLR